MVDDQLQNRRLLQFILAQDDVDVLLAEDGEQGLRMVREEPPELVLLDVMMPGMDGFEVCRRLKSDTVTADVPVIFLTALTESADKVRGIDLGAVDYVTKPFDSAEVLARVRSQLRIRALTASLRQANRELVAKQRDLDADLRAAADIQASLLPRRLPDLSSVDMAWSFVPCQSVGGDIVSVQELGDLLALTVLDVSGHGVPAAMVTVSVSQALGPAAGIVVDTYGTAREPDEVVRRLDREFPMERFDKYFTMAYVSLDPATGEVQYCNAAHPPPMLLRADGSVERLEEGGTIVGMGAVLPFDLGHAILRPGDRLFIITDGITEAPSRSGEEYGEERLLELLQSVGEDGNDRDVRQLCDQVVDAVHAWCGSVSPPDDVTILGLEFLGG